MSNPKYLGMNRNSGMAIEDLDHIRQSVSDILNTPVGSRVMRRNYGSLIKLIESRPWRDWRSCTRCAASLLPVWLSPELRRRKRCADGKGFSGGAHKVRLTAQSSRFFHRRKRLVLEWIVP